MKNKSEIHIAIVDDHDLFRDALKRNLSNLSDVIVVGEAKNGFQLIDLLERVNPDIIIMDVRMPEMDGATATKLALDHHPGVRVIAMSFHTEREGMQLMIEAGAKGFLFKNAGIEEIEKAIRIVQKSKFYFSENVKDVM